MASFFGFGKIKAQTKKEFKDPPNTAVYTTKFVVDDKKTITYVTHDADDGAWQFFSEDNFENFEDVAKIIGLQEVVAMDSTVLDLADMPVGHYATRKDKNDKWTIYKHE